MNVVTDHNEMGTDGRSGSMSVISHSLYFKTWQFGKELCYESFLGLPRYKVIQARTENGQMCPPLSFTSGAPKD